MLVNWSEAFMSNYIKRRIL